MGWGEVGQAGPDQIASRSHRLGPGTDQGQAAEEQGDRGEKLLEMGGGELAAHGGGEVPDSDRRAWMIGAGLDLWQIIRALQDFSGDQARMAQETDVSLRQIQLACAYHQEFTEEIDLAIEADRRPLNQLQREYPFFQSLVIGEIELQIGQISEIVLAPGVELVGPLPAEIQDVTMLAAAVTTTSKAPEAASALIIFLSSPSTAAILKANGFQPPADN